MLQPPSTPQPPNSPNVSSVTYGALLDGSLPLLTSMYIYDQR
jgi:hypothetical protein